MALINIGEEGVDIVHEETGLKVHIDSNLSFVVTWADDIIVAEGSDVRDMIDAGKLAEKFLVETYGGYR